MFTCWSRMILNFLETIESSEYILSFLEEDLPILPNEQEKELDECTSRIDRALDPTDDGIDIDNLCRDSWWVELSDKQKREFLDKELEEYRKAIENDDEIEWGPF